MTEQSRVGRGDVGWATFYLGTGPELVAAGIPAYVLPRDNKRHKLRINARETIIQKKGDRFELMLTWDYNGPWYYSATHPALSELARMILIAVSYWTETGERDKHYLPTDEVPTKKLLEYQSAVDYRLPAHKRFRFGLGVQGRINALVDQIRSELFHAEIMPLGNWTSPPEEFDDNVVDIAKAKQTIDRISKRAKGHDNAA